VEKIKGYFLKIAIRGDKPLKIRKTSPKCGEVLCFLIFICKKAIYVLREVKT
jgi:hypothetical protein